jgi:hypothetical protein
MRERSMFPAMGVANFMVKYFGVNAQTCAKGADNTPMRYRMQVQILTSRIFATGIGAVVAPRHVRSKKNTKTIFCSAAVR